MKQFIPAESLPFFPGLFLPLVLSLIPTTPVVAQDWDDDPAVTSTTVLYERVKGWLLAAAEQAPEALYGYRPTEEVRTFGQILGHVANSSYAFCSAALGEASPNEENLEERTTKPALREALAEAFAYCDRAYATSDESALALTTVFGQQRPALYPLVFNTAHDFEHYGNLVTYLRANGLVPPSSAPRER